MLLSIIIPVYKVEKYIRGTLGSIYSQGVEEELFEVIVVDDGTPDDSMSIVNEFVASHKNITTIHQNNQGLSCARNAGLKIASGDYIWFVDSDDQLSPGGLAQVMQSVEKHEVDILGFNLMRVYDDNRLEEEQKVILHRKNFRFFDVRCTCYDLMYKMHVAPVQRFVFKHSFITGQQLSFYPGIIHEDIEFMARALFLAKDVVLKDIAPYRYLIRTSGSIMSSLNMYSVYSKRIIIDSLIEFARLRCNGLRQRAYMQAIILGNVFQLLTFKSHTTEYINYIKDVTPLLRKLALWGILANVYFHSFRKIAKGLVVVISPRLYMIIWTNNRTKL